MAEHKPLPNQDLLSRAKMDWLNGPCGSRSMPEMSRLSMILNVMTTTPRPTNPNQCISDQAAKAEKLHDREPGLIIKELESRIPGFFDSLPRKNNGSVTREQKGGFISDVIRQYYHLGYRKYGKPNLRSGGADVVTVG